MKINKLTYLIIAIVLIIGLFVFYKSPNSIKTDNLESFKSPSFSQFGVLKAPPVISGDVFLDENGKSRTLSEFKDKILIVNLWATWCAPCVKEMPSLAKFAQKHSEFNIVAISIEKDIKAKAKLNELTGGALKFYQDPTMKIAFSLAAPGLPTTIIYKNGIEIARIPGEAEWVGADADKLAQILKR